MKTLTEALRDTSIESTENEIKIRQNLIEQMVGTIYPSMLNDEITMLNVKLTQLKSNENKQPPGL